MSNQSTNTTSRVAVALLVSILVFNVALTDTGRGQPEPRAISNRPLIDTFSNMSQAVIEKTATGIIVELFTDQQVAACQDLVSQHNKRNSEYVTKKQLLDKRFHEFQGRVPKSILAAESHLVRFLKECDGNENGKLEAAEFRADDSDVDNDGIISKPELTRYWVKAEYEGRRPTPDIDKVDAMLKEHADILARQTKLQGEFANAHSPLPVPVYYRIVEVAPTYIRLQSDAEERIIPMDSIDEFRRKLAG